MALTVTYEWLLETVIDDEYGDVDDVDHFETLAALKRDIELHPCEPGYRYDYGLVCDIHDTETEHLVDRLWAYFDADGQLPAMLSDACQRPARKVPQRYQREAAQ